MKSNLSVAGDSPSDHTSAVGIGAECSDFPGVEASEDEEEEYERAKEAEADLETDLDFLTRNICLGFRDLRSCFMVDDGDGGCEKRKWKAVMEKRER